MFREWIHFPTVKKKRPKKSWPRHKADQESHDPVVKPTKKVVLRLTIILPFCSTPYSGKTHWSLPNTNKINLLEHVPVNIKSHLKDEKFQWI